MHSQTDIPVKQRRTQPNWRSNSYYLLSIQVIQVVVDKLHAGGEVGLVELVGDVPTQGAKLTPLLDGGVQERHGVQDRFPLHQIGDLQLLLLVAR